jgi:hypothetical protein
MYMVRNFKELRYENMEVLSCHFHLQNHYGCARGIERFWNRWCESVLWPNVWYFVPAFCFTVRTGCRIGKSSVASALAWILCCAGEIVMNNKVSTVYRTYQGRVDPREAKGVGHQNNN